MKEDEINAYNDLEKEIKEIYNIIDFISPKKYLELKKIFNKNLNNYKAKDKVKDLENLIKNKMKKIIDNYFNIDFYSGMMSQISSELNIDPNKNSRKRIAQRLRDMKENLSGIGNPFQVISDFGKKIDSIYYLESNNDTAKKCRSDYNIMHDYFKNTYNIRYLLVGPHNSGKSSLLNNIIGYGLNLLPTQMKECTKVGVIIKYTEKKEDIKLYKTELITNKLGKNYFSECNDNCTIAKGEKGVHNKLNELNNNIYANDRLDFYLLQTPIEFFDSMNLTPEQKNKIEIIDFPGLDTKFEEAKTKAQNLLKIIDGFIFVYSSLTYSKDYKDIFRLVYHTIKERPTFTFDTCLFILNRIDELNEVDLEKETKTILDIFDKDNSSMDSGEVIAMNKRIGDKSLTLSKFSCLLYKEYKEFRNNISNFEEFIDLHKKIEKKSMFKINLFKEENEAKTILKNIKDQNYILINPKLYGKFRVKDKAFNEYLDRIKKLKIENAEEKDLKELVKFYLYILVNQKQNKKYQLSCIETLLGDLKKVIDNTQEFFFNKQQIDTSHFVSDNFSEIIDLLYITKKKMNNENIEQFKLVDKAQIYKDIQIEAKHVKDILNIKFDSAQESINREIKKFDKKKSRKELEEKFSELVNLNKDAIDNLLSTIDSSKKEFDQFLTEKNTEVITKLNLQELQKDKEAFKNNMSKFESASIKNISGEAKDYNIIKKSKTFFFFTKENYDIDETLKKYQEEVDKFFISKDEVIKVIDKNKDKVINDLEGLFEKFNQQIDGFKNHFNDFENTVKEIEQFIYKVFGIRD